MELIEDFFENLRTLSESQQILGFINHNLLLFVFTCLAFGFAVILVEIRLPLKYYWDLPLHLLTRLLIDFHLLPKGQIWGKCLDSQINQPIPVTAIELLDQKAKNIIKTTYSNRYGDYGFKIKPGEYVVRAIKNYYVAPPFFDPENIRLKSSNESLALRVQVKEDAIPHLNLILQPVLVVDESKPLYRLWFYFRTFSLGLGNGLLLLAVFGSWYGWVIRQDLLYAILLAVGLVLIMVKLYFLETVDTVSND